MGQTTTERAEGEQGKGQVTEPKTVGGPMAQTPREKRLQSRAERTGKAQIKEITTKATKQELKGKTHTAKQAKTISTRSPKTVSTGSPKTVSIGSMKIVDTGLSTGSMETEEQKEKSPEILAREAATMLATLSTYPKKKKQ